MEHLVLVLWLCLYPLTSAIGNYFHAKKRSLYGKKVYPDNALAFSAFMDLIIWIAVSYFIYKY